MKFKKWLAVLLALMMLLSLLAGCAKNDDDDDDDDDEKTSTTAATDAGDETKPEKEPEGDPTKATKGEAEETKAPEKDEPEEPTEEPEEPEDSEILDEPEVLFNGEDIENFYVDVEMDFAGTTIAVELGMKLFSDGSGIIYLDGEVDSDYMGVILEDGEDDEVICYSRAKKSDAFKQNDAMTEEDVENILAIVEEIMETIAIEDWSEICDGLKKVKAANKNVYTYEMLMDDEVVGTVSVDKKTGLLTAVEIEVDGDEASMTVNDFSLTDAKIPSYTKAPEKEPEVEPTKPVEDDDVGTVLDEPEVVVDAEEINEFYADFEMTVSDVTVNLAIGMEGILDEEGVIYLEGEMDSEYRAMIIEVNGDEEWTAYTRTKKSDAFKKDTSVTEDDVLEALDIVESMLETFVIEDWSDIGDELKKIESANKNVYTYEIVALDEVLGTVSVDKTTGIVTEMEMEGLSMKINDFSLTDAKIPTY